MKMSPLQDSTLRKSVMKCAVGTDVDPTRIANSSLGFRVL